MWICQRCYTENRESSTVCEGCGAPRAAGRFSSTAPQRPSRPAQAPIMTFPGTPNEAPQQHAPAQTPARNDYQVTPPDLGRPIKPKPPFVLRLARFVGILLSVLLPVLTALLAWRQYDALSASLIPLLLGDNPANWMRIALYAVFSLLAVLISLLPGLWTLLLSRRRE